MTENSISVGKMIGSSIVNSSVTGDIAATGSSFEMNPVDYQMLGEVVLELETLINKLEKSGYSSDTTAGKMKIATEVIEQVDQNPSLTKRLFSAIKAGGVQSLEQALNHPASSFIIGALEDWKKSKK
jgi:hypothetical protein